MSDRCVTRPGKITIDARQARGGCCCKLGFYYGNSHTRILGTAGLNRLRDALRILTHGAYYGTSRNIL